MDKFFMTHSEFMSWTPPPQFEVIGSGILSHPGNMFLFSPEGQGKTVLLFQLAYAVATGTLWMGFPCTKGVVLIVQNEIAMALYKKRILKFLAANGLTHPNNIVYMMAKTHALDTIEGLTTFTMRLDILRENGIVPTLIILDPFISIVREMYNADNMGTFLYERFPVVQEKYNFSTAIAHHTRKVRLDTKGQVIWLGSDEMLGPPCLKGWADHIIGLRPSGLEDGNAQLQFLKHRNTEKDLAPLNIHLSHDMLKIHII